ncbi:DUF6059 family protein [Streptomyces sp. NPDC005423]|uniref:DUF6059 family protein n=1 Tax=Streptomyces sp. NPDC005423 TaxID=3155343 RepID=UPI0033B9C02E
MPGTRWWDGWAWHARRWIDDILGAFSRPYVTPSGPPPGHPERLRPDVPLTEAELRLARQLMLWRGMRKAPSVFRGRPGQRPNR